MTDIALREIFEILETLWPNPQDFWTNLTACSKKFITHFGQRILPFLRNVKKLMNCAYENLDEIDSWKPLNTVISDDEYATISCPSEIWSTALNMLIEYSERETTDNSLLSLTTAPGMIGITSTSSTTAVGQQEPAGAAPLPGSPLLADDDELFGLEELEENISNISEYICSYTPDTVCTISSPAPDGKFLVQMKLIPFKDAKTVPKEQLWTKMTKSVQFVATNNRREKKHTKSHANQSKKEVSEILEFFKKFPVCPLLSSCKTVQWLENVSLQNIGRSDLNFQTAIDIFQREICNKSITELIEFYLNSTPLFGCTSGHIYDYYYVIEESADKLKALLLYQYNNDEDSVFNFLNILYKVLDRKIEKKNCIQIRGPSNAGKTLFSKVCAALCLVKGQISNFNKYNQFPLQDCVDKRILIWDEPNCEPSAFDTCKMLFAGDPCMANIKYQTHVQIDKTPVIIITNCEEFTNNEIFNNRMYKFDWYRAPLLKDFVKHIHPLALYELWKEYNIIYN